MGLSSVFHFANLNLGMGDRETRLFLYVAEKLEPLPILTQIEELSEPNSFEEELVHWLVRRAKALARESAEASPETCWPE